jgi:serine/threonine protein kinase
MKRNVIGEGGYGCVLKPSIHCKTLPSPKFKYDNYVSKIMKTRNATKELDEFVIIGRLDPTNEYHLGKPILCQPNLDEPNVKMDIAKCKYIPISDVNANPDKYSLLVLKNGGPDLKALCSDHLIKYLRKGKQIKTDRFWLEVHHLIKGLKFFKDNGMVHYDIKPQNILFDLKDGSMKYIDFGLMETKALIVEKSKHNMNSHGSLHWSYPFDCGFMNRDNFNRYKDTPRKIMLKNELSEMIVSDTKLNTFNLPIRKPQAFKILFTYINPDNVIPDVATQYGYISAFFNGFNQLITEKKYDAILDQITNSIDVFGLGFTLQFMANCFKRHDALSLEDFTTLSAFFHKMYDFNPLTRTIDIDDLLDEYENILLQNGVLTRLNKSFANHVVVDKQPAPTLIMEQSKIEATSRPEHLSIELQEFANEDPIIDVTLCPGKEYNPFTKRCVKKCKPGFSRNSKFHCRKNKTAKIAKTSKAKKQIICPDDKELNPKTNRCVTKCKPGTRRNHKFQCRKKKGVLIEF